MYDRVSVHVKVSKVKDPTEVPTGKKIAIVLLSIEYLTSFTILLKNTLYSPISYSDIIFLYANDSGEKMVRGKKFK